MLPRLTTASAAIGMMIRQIPLRPRLTQRGLATWTSYFKLRIVSLGTIAFALFLPTFAMASPEQAFWQWFQRNENVLFDFEHDQERIFDRLENEMHKVDPDLTFEFGPKQAGRREFVISADGILRAFPKVESLFSTAPKLPKWKFIKFRPRRPPFDLDMNGVHVDINRVLVKLSREGKRAGIAVLIPGYTQSRQQAYLGLSFLILDQALGEYDVETRVGSISVDEPGQDHTGLIPVAALPAAFDKLMAEH